MYPMHQNEGGPLFCECKGYIYHQHCRHLKMFQEGDYYVKVRYKVTFDNGFQQWEISGEEVFEHQSLTAEELIEKAEETKNHLSKMLGMKVEIMQVDV